MKTAMPAYPMPTQPKTPAELVRIAYPFLAALASMASVACILALVDTLSK